MPLSDRCRASLAVLMLAAPALRADVTVTRVTSSGGINGMGAYESRSTEEYRGASRRSDTSIKMTGAVLGKLGSGERSEITIVPEDKVYTVDHKRKSYRAGTITETARLFEKARGGGKPGKGAGKSGARITKSQFKAEATGQKKRIAAFPCELFRITMVMEMEDEAGRKSETRIVTESWNTPETAALTELKKAEAVFYAAYLKKMGLQVAPDQMSQMGGGMAAMLGVSEEELAPKLAAMKKEAEKVKGYPVAVDVKWFSEGDEKAAPRAAKAAPEDDGMPNLSGGASGLLGGMAAKMAKKKMAESAEKKRAASAGGAAFSSHSELVSVKTGAVAPERFEPPAGYKVTK